jgi:hypothetical protein
VAETTNGRISAIKKNDHGYYAFKIGEAWYNAGKKFEFEKGDVIEFDFYLKDDKWKTVKGDISKLEQAPAASSAPAKGGVSRDDYWTRKEAKDDAAIPRIIYMAAYERAVQFAALALANGALSLEKVKQADKLDIIQKFVEEHAFRIAGASLAATLTAVPNEAAAITAAQDKKKAAPKIEEVEGEGDPENWS